jgi:hypothetical protein
MSVTVERVVLLIKTLQNGRTSPVLLSVTLPVMVPVVWAKTDKEISNRKSVSKYGFIINSTNI